MRGWWLGVALLAGGCYQPNAEAPCSVTCDFAHQGPCPGELQCQQDNVCRSAGASTCPDAGHPDGPPIPIDSPSAMCHGNAQGLLRICLDIEPTQPLDLVATEPIQTDSDPRCTTYHQSTNPDDDVCLIQGTMIAIEPGVVISVVGFRPLVLYAASTLSVMGTIDASSSVANKYAHPGGALDCGAPGVTNGAGGEGGSFGSQGGDGGAGASESGAGNGGLAKPAFAPTVVRGGCRGTDGSSADTQENSKGGTGGGAVYMIANGQIFVSGTINASGSGGPGTGFYSGGGGGGSGGLVGLDAPMVTVSGIILANGGAGSSGGVEGTGGIAPGDDPSPSDALSPALGHPNTTSLSAAGGNGGVLTGGGMSGSSVGGTRGGGGGGGGVGYLAVYSAAFTAAGIVSPPASAP